MTAARRISPTDRVLLGPHAHAVRTIAMAAATSLAVATQLHAQSAFPVPADSVTRRLMQRLSALSADSMEGRRAGSEGSRRARRWIIGELTAVGARPIGTSFEQAVRLGARSRPDTLGANVIARVAGSVPGGGTIVVSAHYDHLGSRVGEIFNGADDDASGCVALIALAERLRAAPIRHDVLLVFFDGEEAGMPGSRTFVASPPIPLGKIVVDLSLDMISRQDGQALWVSGTSHYPVLKPVARRAAEGSRIPIKFGHDRRTLVPGDDWTNSSDHAAFHATGIPFLYLGVEDHADYHGTGDDAEKVDPNFYRGAVDFAERLLRGLDRWATSRS